MFARQFVRSAAQRVQTTRFASTVASVAKQSRSLRDLAALGVVGGAFLASLHFSKKAECSGEDHVPLPHLDWDFQHWTKLYDPASLRRGFEVYRQVCSTCHSLEYIHYRNLVGVTHTKEQAEALAKSVEVTDGPDDEGNMFERPGILADLLPKPYPNDKFARAANGGAMPPDLSLMAKAREDGPDYLYNLLQGYKNEPPAGIKAREGQYYNIYFPGGLLSMPPPLTMDGQLEYEDGTEATIPQMAKDVTEFLQWCAEPELDDRKRFLFKTVPVLLATAVVLGYTKRKVWAPVKGRQLSWRPVPKHYSVKGAHVDKSTPTF